MNKAKRVAWRKHRQKDKKLTDRRKAQKTSTTPTQSSTARR